MASGSDTFENDRPTAAAYIAALSGDLAALARSHGLDTLGYLLDMAKLEAENQSSDPRPTPRSLSAS